MQIRYSITNFFFRNSRISPLAFFSLAGSFSRQALCRFCTVLTTRFTVPFTDHGSKYGHPNPLVTITFLNRNTAKPIQKELNRLVRSAYGMVWRHSAYLGSLVGHVTEQAKVFTVRPHSMTQHFVLQTTFKGAIEIDEWCWKWSSRPLDDLFKALVK